MQQRARNSQTAQFTARELTAAFAQPAVQPVVLKQFLQPDLLQHGAKRIIRGLWRGQQQVIAQGGAKQMHALRNDAHRLAQGLLAEIGQQRVIKTNMAALRIPGAGQQLQQRRFTAAGTAEDRHPLTCVNRKVDTVQRVLRLFVIGEGDIFKRQRNLLWYRGLPGTERDFRLLLGNLRDAQGRGDHLAQMLEGARYRG